MTDEHAPILIVHGGAWRIPEEQHSAHLDGMRAALEAGRRVLGGGGPALDAVEAAIAVMEEEPAFDAGRGSCLNTDGSVEMDASIMDGRDLAAGAVAALRNFLHPIRIARRVMEETEHILLAGEGAAAFARAAGFAPVDSMELLTEREKERLRALRKDAAFRTPYAFGRERVGGCCGDRPGPGGGEPPGLHGNEHAGPSRERSGGEAGEKRGTVGAAARDGAGNLAAGTSTGGTPKKIPGRVGDSALVGCGTFADNRAGAVSVTGWGESIIRCGTARTVIDRLRSGEGAEAAARFAVAELAKEARGLGGVIVIDAAGGRAAHFNTPHMARGWWTRGMTEPFVAVRGGASCTGKPDKSTDRRGDAV